MGGFHWRDACREGLEVEVERRADRKRKKLSFGKITAFNMFRPRSTSSRPSLPFLDGVMMEFHHKNMTSNADIL